MKELINVHSNNNNFHDIINGLLNILKYFRDKNFIDIK
jgi:hypothetical protein